MPPSVFTAWVFALAAAAVPVASLRAQTPAADPTPDCTIIAKIADSAAFARDLKTSREVVADTAVGDHPKLPAERVRLFASRVFEAPVPAEFAAAEAYSACLAHWAGIGDLSLTQERIDFLAACARGAATGGAVSCGYAEIAAHSTPPRPTEPIPSVQQLAEIEGRVGRSLVVVRASEFLELGVMAPSGDYAIVLMSDLERGQEVFLASRETPQWQSSRVIGVDAKSRIAVIAPALVKAQPAVAADPDSLVNGQPLVAVSGQPAARLVALANTEKTVARVLGRAECWPTFVEMVADHSAPEVPGPVFDLQGRFVAFGSLYYSPEYSLPLYTNFGYPASTVLAIAERVRRYGYWRHGRMGVTVQEVTPQLAAAFGMTAPTGALINGVDRGSPADKAGLRPSDIVLAINGQTLSRSCQLPGRTLASLPGDVMRLTVRRHDAFLTIDVKLAEAPPTKAE